MSTLLIATSRDDSQIWTDLWLDDGEEQRRYRLDYDQFEKLLGELERLRLPRCAQCDKPLTPGDIEPNGEVQDEIMCRDCMAVGYGP